MDTPSEIKDQLASLRIPKDRRPRSGSGSRCQTRCRWVSLLVFLLAIGLGTTGYIHRDRLGNLIDPTATAAEIKLVTATAAPPPAPPVLTATGRIVSDHKVQVNTKVSGQITALFFEQGDKVEQGQRLALLEDVIYRARRDEAAAQLDRAKANLDFQKFNYERVAGLIKQNTAGQVEFAEARRLIREAEAQVAAAQASLDQAQKSLDDCTVAAPIAGVVLERNVEVGDFVAAEGGRGANANAQFGLIADMTKLRLEVDVSELDVARIRPDMPCTIRPDAYKDRRYDGHVMWIDPGADYSKATVQVKVRIANPDDRLRVEGSAQVVFLAEPHASDAASDEATSAWIPQSACKPGKSPRTASVFVVDQGRLRETTITVGRSVGGQVEVVVGLVPGQSVAGDNLDRLVEGQRVGR